jgi:hypothetical protein
MKVVLEVDDVFKDEYSEYDLKMYAAVRYYEKRLMSTGVLAKMVGISRLKFINEMSEYGSGLMDMTEEE